MRTGENLKMGIHFPADLATEEPNADVDLGAQNARLLHFDGLTPLHIALKLLKRANEPVYKPPRIFGVQREKQLRFTRNHADRPRQMAKMLEGVFGLTDEQAAALGEAHVDIAFDPSPALAALGLQADLSVERFDAELRVREAALIEKSGLVL